MSGDDVAWRAAGRLPSVPHEPADEPAGVASSGSIVRLERATPKPTAGDTRRQPPTIRVLLLGLNDDDRTLVGRLLARAPHARFVVTVACDPLQAVDRLLAGLHDVGLVELELFRSSTALWPRVGLARSVTASVILLGEAASPALIADLVAAGAADYLDKDELDVERLERAVYLTMARRRRPVD